MFACTNNHPKIVAALLEKGADPSLRDNSGRTALTLSCNCTNILIQLLRTKVDVNSKSKCGITPLMLAWFCGNPTAVYILLSRGANVESFDEGNRTAFSFSKDDIKRLLKIKQSLEPKIDLSQHEIRPLVNPYRDSLDSTD
ncbi:MAG: hypothetical protein A6F71_08430 [Cycloclasticus sp. symbiont of Poecilosclerida sp. M]|nr:MAG: hypothetical protein A6F71_08430 [Cycloclasticus sp. symbiont of Poecilosclerida sp. M]